jgi:hypothetical protein
MTADKSPRDRDALVSGQSAPRTTVEALPRDLHELRRRCRTLDAAIAAADPARIAASARLVASGWQTARATLDNAAGNNPHGANAYIALHAAHAVIGQMFQRAYDRLDGGSGPGSRARITLHELAATLELSIDAARAP